MWTPSVGEELSCFQENHNPYDGYAVCVRKDGFVVGDVPRENSSVPFFLLLKRGGKITAEVTGPHKNRGLDTKTLPELLK